MRLQDFFTEDVISLDLRSRTKDDVLRELIDLLKLEPRPRDILFQMLKKREKLGSTGIGKGVAIPHCRSLVVNRLRVAFGRSEEGIDFQSIDSAPAHYFFLIIAPPLEVSNQYLPVLGRVAQFCKDPETLKKLKKIEAPKDFLKLLEGVNV